jgi:chaperonin cofactor prefoldin
VQEIETRAISAQQEINVVKAQISSKQREMRLLELTSDELGQVPKETNVYEGVGKMYGDLLPSYLIRNPSSPDLPANSLSSF